MNLDQEDTDAVMIRGAVVCLLRAVACVTTLYGSASQTLHARKRGECGRITAAGFSWKSQTIKPFADGTKP